MSKTSARIHAILPRKGNKAVVFRRGPASCVAVIGWDLATDTFKVGQWLRGRIYPFRCDLSPKGEYLLYFAAKYGTVNPVEKFVNDKVIAAESKVGGYSHDSQQPPRIGLRRGAV